MLKQKIEEHLNKYRTPKTVFCQRIGISASALYRYLKGDLYLSEETENRISNYLEQFK